MMTSQIIDLGDGRELLISIRAKAAADEGSLTLKDLWLPDAPFSYHYFLSELNRNNVIDDDQVWVLRPVRGNHHTASFHVRGCYEALLHLGCIEELSFRKVQDVFNNTFRTDIKCSKVIENKNKCYFESQYFIKIFEAFANPHTNPESNHLPQD